jgi:excisionase family DNA binding protein
MCGWEHRWVDHDSGSRGRLGVVPLTIRRWLDEGRLRDQKVGRSWVVEEAAVAQLESRRV